MLGETAAFQLLEQTVSALPREVGGVQLAADAYVLARDAALTRFANNAIHQNVAERNARVVVRVLLGQRVGQAVTNDISAAGLERAAQAALTAARFYPENPDLQGLSPAERIIPVESFDGQTAGCTPERRATAVNALCARAAENDLVAAGAFETALVERAIVSSAGVRAYHAGTEADFQTVVMSADSSGWASEASWRLGDLDTEALGNEAIATAERGRGPRSLAPGTYPVVLAPDAVHDIVHMLAVPGSGALAVQEGRSWMSGRHGEALMSPAVSIWDDGRERQGWPIAFDGEGVPKQRVDIVSAGRAGSPVYDSMTAGREPGRRSTGHAIPPFEPLIMSWGPLPLNLHMATGDASLEELIAATARGVFVTRFWYTRTVHPREVVITGMTRDGTFWIEDGALAYPVHSLRFTQAYVKALAGVAGAGREARTGRSWGGTITAPALKLDAFTFTGQTVKG